MSTVQLVLLIIGGMTISLIAIHLWIGLIDGIIAVLRKVFHIRKKNKTTWHTLDDNQQKPPRHIGAKKTYMQDREE